MVFIYHYLISNHSESVFFSQYLYLQKFIFAVCENIFMNNLIGLLIMIHLIQ